MSGRLVQKYPRKMFFVTTDSLMCGNPSKTLDRTDLSKRQSVRHPVYKPVRTPVQKPVPNRFSDICQKPACSKTGSDFVLKRPISFLHRLQAGDLIPAAYALSGSATLVPTGAGSQFALPTPALSAACEGLQLVGEHIHIPGSPTVYMCEKGAKTVVSFAIAFGRKHKSVR